MRRSHLFSQGDSIDQETNSHFGSADSSLVMELGADRLKGVKRIRLNSGAAARTACMWDISREDACRLELGIGPADCTNTTSISWTSCIDNESNLGHPLLVTSGDLPSCTATMDLSHSLGPAAHMDVAGSLDLAMSLSNGLLRPGSWNSTDSLRIEEPKEHNVLPAVELGLGLNVIPVISSADSVLTSAYPASINHMDTSSVVNTQIPVSSFSSLYQDGSSHTSYNIDVPMIDEGSTSNGTYILPFLKSHRSAIVSTSDAQKFESSFAAVPESVMETDMSMSFKASSGTTSTSGTSSGVGDRAAKICRFTGCAKRARGASGLCISHGGGRRCQRPGCNKGAEGSTIFCKAHGGGRRCERLGCTKSAEGKTDFCIAHGGGSRCLYDGCTKAARGRTGFCIRHGGGKRCQKEGCTKSAEGYSALCIAHGGGKRCQYPNCDKGAQGSTLLCKGHGGGKRCTVEGCNKGAEGSTSLCKGHGGGKRCMFEGGGVCSKSVHGGTLYCVAHGGGKRCIVQGCTKSARGRTDSCVKHGGGKRCKFENCDKSAQGSTDFCKAHGGGKRCTWGQEGSVINGEGYLKSGWDFLEGSCDRYAKGKLGLCAEHSALLQDQRVHGTGAFGGTLSSRVEVGSSYKEVARSCHTEENFLSSLNASGNLPQAMEDALCAEGAELHLQACPSHRSFWQEGDRMHFHRLQRSEFPSTLGCYTSGFPVNFSISKPASIQPSVSSRMFGLAPMQWPALGRQGECGPSTRSNMEDDAIFNMSSLSLPEERVHGGNIMALLSGKPPK